MTSVLPQNQNVVIRPVQYRDLEGIERLSGESCEAEQIAATDIQKQLQLLRHWYGLLKFFSLFP
jgi:hypothetical protein